MGTHNNAHKINTNSMAELATQEVKLFGKWSFDDVEINDISLEDYIAVKPKYATFVPHSAGRYAAKRFRKAQCPIVERVVNSLMMHGRNNGKKLMGENCQTRDGYHLLINGPKSITSGCRCHHQRWTERRRHARRLCRRRSKTSGGHLPVEKSQRRHLLVDDGRERSRVQKRQDDGGMLSG